MKEIFVTGFLNGPFETEDMIGVVGQPIRSDKGEQIGTIISVDASKKTFTARIDDEDSIDIITSNQLSFSLELK